jgi:hypothetical protein
VTLAVTSLNRQLESLKAAGLPVGEPMKGPKVNVVMIKDPDGNSIAFAEALDPSMAH